MDSSTGMEHGRNENRGQFNEDRRTLSTENTLLRWTHHPNVHLLTQKTVILILCQKEWEGSDWRG
jgi:hypothetical protein